MTTNHVPLFAGLLVGFSIAVPIGPMGLLCIQRTLACGMRIGVSTGLGAATVNVLYGALILLGLEAIGPHLAGFSRALGFGGGLFLLWSAIRTLMRRDGPNATIGLQVLSPLAAYRSAVAFNAVNPISPVRILALLSPIVGLSVPTLSEATALLLGMFLAAMMWWVSLSGGVALLRSHLAPQALVRLNQLAGSALTIYAILALAQAITH